MYFNKERSIKLELEKKEPYGCNKQKVRKNNERESERERVCVKEIEREEEGQDL